MSIVYWVVTIVLIFIYINHIYKKTNFYKNSLIDIKQFIDGVPQNLSIANTGSTYSKFAFGESGYTGLDWGDFSLQAQSLEMDKAILKKYINNISNSGIVVVVVAACLFLYEGKDNNEIYNHILKNRDNPTNGIISSIKAFFPLLCNPQNVIKIIKDDPKVNAVYDSFPEVMSNEEAEGELEHLVKLWCNLFKLKDLKQTCFSIENEMIMEKNVHFLEDIIDICINNSKIPIIVVPPFSSKLNSYFSEEFKKIVLDSNVKNAVGERSIIIFDYQKDAYFQNRYDLFVDGGFRLNKRGSDIFIERFMKDLKMRGLKINRKESW